MNIKSQNNIKKITLVLFIVSSFIISCNNTSNSKKKTNTHSKEIVVTPNNFIRAETDKMFSDMIKNAGGTNKFYHFRTPTPLDKQTVIRMNLDVLYSGGVFDAKEGLTIKFPKIDDKRYATVEVISNDHYVVDILHEPGEYHIKSDTRFVYVIVRIQLKSPSDKEDIKLVNALQDKFIVTSKSNKEYKTVNWNQKSLDSLRTQYLADSKNYDGFSGMMGKKGEVNEKTRHIAAAGGWGLFPDAEAIYLLYQNSHLEARKAYIATYTVPENKGFWSITVYGKDGYIKNNNSYLSSSNVKYNKDGSFTVCYGDSGSWDNSPNKLEVSEGWNFLFRIYRPDKTVLKGEYKLPEVELVN